jgi:hypothetical protein
MGVFLTALHFFILSEGKRVKKYLKMDKQTFQFLIIFVTSIV